MVKFGKNKLKTLKKLAKKQNSCTITPSTSNKIIKKKINAEKKISFQKEVLLQEAFKSDGLVRKRPTQILQDKSKKVEKQTVKQESEVKKVKLKPVEKQKRRQKTQISDTKLLLSLMKKK